MAKSGSQTTPASAPASAARCMRVDPNSLVNVGYVIDIATPIVSGPLVDAWSTTRVVGHHFASLAPPAAQLPNPVWIPFTTAVSSAPL